MQVTTCYFIACRKGCQWRSAVKVCVHAPPTARASAQVWDLNARKAKKPDYVAAARALLARS